MFINLFVDNTATFLLNGSSIKVKQATRYPWDGKVEISLFPTRTKKFKVKLRRPGWANHKAIPGDLYRFTDEGSADISVMVNGKPADYQMSDGYIVIERRWIAGDLITYEIPMEIQRIVADTKVEADLDQFAVQRGPLVFCAEWPDNEEGRILDLRYDKKSPFTTQFEPDLLDGTQIIKTKTSDPVLPREVTLIPYHLWNNRGSGEMRVWLPLSEN